MKCYYLAEPLEVPLTLHSASGDWRACKEMTILAEDGPCSSSILAAGGHQPRMPTPSSSSIHFVAQPGSFLT